MKLVRGLFLVGGLAMIFASCATHRGESCPAYRTSVDVESTDDLAAESVVLEDVN